MQRWFVWLTEPPSASAEIAPSEALGYDQQHLWEGLPDVWATTMVTILVTTALH
jgi:hypothetical protein